MEIEAAQSLGALLGAAGGAFLAALGATWLAFVRPLKKQVEESPAGINKHITEVVQVQKDLERRIVSVEKTQEGLDERLRKAVTDDEFSTYTQSTTQSIQQLSEKIGQARGAIELWLSDRRNR